ncbi:ABC transporter ATP-binding protein [Phytoactinopolyspora halotolerans]|uniref:ABC transporter ATP-binding protein n=1 Tax=Phytoactinopolyspora halotolerans TaxID=1981512 RepID=A0A6L9SCC2_9ACTN|nr:ABC transporter ATP-binding protein [Phytoactinopolyspora halotolerans]NEE02723.1 ABC transporter ATP-binding protein [Phytoactinopolyspora halotolerans]
MSDVVVVENLTVGARTGPVLSDVSYRLGAGGRLAIVGESGAGKTTLALAALGVVRPGLRRQAGTVHLTGRDLFALPERARRSLRRHATAWLAQDPAAALTPTMPVGRQIAELLESPSPARVAARLRAVDLPDDEEFRRRLPGQLSGGQQRRLALARALAARPQLVVLDEPTAGLDTVTSRAVVAEIERWQAELGFALLVVTHDLELAARACDELLVLHDGRAVDTGPTVEVLISSRQEYTRRLVDAYPDAESEPSSSQQRRATTRRAGAQIGDGSPTTPSSTDGRPVLRADDVHAGFGTTGVLHGVSLDVAAGECVAIIGASGSGKTTLARSIVGLHPPSDGRIVIDGTAVAPHAAGRGASERAAVQLVPQDPFGSLHPRRSVLASVARPARLLHGESRTRAAGIAAELLERVGVGAADGRRRPAELSGGQRQRVALARALAARPSVLICDEVTSALDTTVAAAVLDLIDRLRDELGVAVVFITHELGHIRRVADRVVVLDAGRVRESGPTADVFDRPRHPVTASLVGAVTSLRATLATAPPPRRGPETAHLSTPLGGNP